jgi:hypothetical protein
VSAFAPHAFSSGFATGGASSSAAKLAGINSLWLNGAAVNDVALQTFVELAASATLAVIAQAPSVERLRSLSASAASLSVAGQAAVNCDRPLAASDATLAITVAGPSLRRTRIVDASEGAAAVTATANCVRRRNALPDAATLSLTGQPTIGLQRSFSGAAALALTGAVPLTRQRNLPSAGGIIQISALPRVTIARGMAIQQALLTLDIYLLWERVQELAANGTLALTGTMLPFDHILAGSGSTSLTGSLSSVRTRLMHAAPATLSLGGQLAPVIRWTARPATLTLSGALSPNIYDSSEGVTYSLYGIRADLTISGPEMSGAADLSTATPLAAVPAALTVGMHGALQRVRNTSIDVAVFRLSETFPARGGLRHSLAGAGGASVSGSARVVYMRAALRATGSASIDYLALLDKESRLFAAPVQISLVPPTLDVERARGLRAPGGASLSVSAPDLRYATKLFAGLTQLLLDGEALVNRVVAIPPAHGVAALTHTSWAQRTISLRAEAQVAALGTAADMITNINLPVPPARTFVAPQREQWRFAAEPEQRTFYVA